MPREDAKHVEDLEILAGRRRGQSAGKAAVRYDDLAALVDLPSDLKSGYAAGAAPTAAEHDALVDDLHAIALHLSAVGIAVQLKRTLK